MTIKTIGPGTPQKWNEERKRLLLERLAKGLRRGAAAKSVGMTWQAIWKHAKADERLEREILEAEMLSNELVEDALFRAATVEGNVKAQIIWLTNRMPDRWKARHLRAENEPDQVHQHVHLTVDKARSELVELAATLRDRARAIENHGGGGNGNGQSNGNGHSESG